MMRKGLVKKTLGDKVWVEILKDHPLDDISQHSSCSCSSCAGCHTQENHVLVDTSIEVQPGDRVELHLESWKLFTTAIIAFILPVFSLIFALWISRDYQVAIQKWALVLSFLAFSFLIAYIFDKFNKAKVKLVKVLEKDQTNE
ncbi:MAG TPA: SoxR reducing system RseC family protein [Caldisericia bacterium]|nr:SoxR reducing system RseC family protein [Caldisericia bacterium]